MGRPSTPLLSPEAIAAAALRLVDRTGEFTIAQVADALGVRPSSLYNHLGSKAEIVEAMRSQVFREGDVSPENAGPWDETVRTLLRRYRECFARHPRFIPLVTAYTVSSPEVMAMYDELAETLDDAGVSAGQLLDVITMCDSVVLGAALDIAAPDLGWDVDRARSPALVAAIQQAGTGRERSDRAFDLALDLLVAGIAGLVDSR
jgi:AcrR family transcriptional regulator